MTVVLLAAGIAIALVGAVLVSEEKGRVPKRGGTRFEVVGAGALLVGLGVAMAYAGITA